MVSSLARCRLYASVPRESVGGSYEHVIFEPDRMTADDLRDAALASEAGAGAGAGASGGADELADELAAQRREREALQRRSELQGRKHADARSADARLLAQLRKDRVPASSRSEAVSLEQLLG